MKKKCLVLVLLMGLCVIGVKATVQKVEKNPNSPTLKVMRSFPPLVIPPHPHNR